MLPIAELARDSARQIRGVFTDIDGTLTDNGKLGSDAYAALWCLRAAGLKVVPVTGRPAGWCDLIARQWPVDGVIGENGALAFYEHERRLRRLFHPACSEGHRAQLEAIRDEVLREVPGTAVAQDQAYRMFDLAIDYNEEARLPLADAERVRDIFVRRGAVAKVSDIHVNGWYGDYDKLTMARYFAQHVWQTDLDAERDRYIYCGDSPNDEPMFGYFPNACGVANVRAFSAHLQALPRYVTTAAGSAGFAEMAQVLLSRRI